MTQIVGSSLMPLLYGYLRVRIASSPDAAEQGRRLLGEFALREGFALVDVYVDADENRPCAALCAMIDSLSRSSLDARSMAVAVPHLGHFGAHPRAQQQMLRRVERETEVQVLVVQW